LCKLQQNEFRSILQNVVKYLKQGDSLPKRGEEIDDEQKKDQLDLMLLTPEEENKNAALVALFYLVRGLVRTKILTSAPTSAQVSQKEKLKQAISEIVGLPEAQQKDLFQICTVLTSGGIEDELLTQKTHFPHLKQFRWRVDVSISTDVMSRVMKPTILMELTLENGEIKVFEMTPQRFQELRYKVARVLKDMYDLEKNPILKVDK